MVKSNQISHILRVVVCPTKGYWCAKRFVVGMALVKFVFMSDVIARTKRDKEGAPNAMEELIISHLSNRPQFL